MKIQLSKDKCIVCKKGNLKSLNIDLVEENPKFQGLYSMDTECNDLFCEKCGAYFTCCPDCSSDLFCEDQDTLDKNAIISLCTFLGYDDPELQEHKEPTYFMTDGDFNIGEIGHNLSHENKMYISYDDYISHNYTGPDGGYYHYWKCTECKKILSLTDK